MPINPVGFRVIVKPDKLEEVNKAIVGDTLAKIGFEIKTEGDKKRIEGGVAIGTLVAVGKTAWKAYDDGEPWAKVGDRVYFVKHGGTLIEDPATKEEFRLLNDEDITAVLI